MTVDGRELGRGDSVVLDRKYDENQKGKLTPRMRQVVALVAAGQEEQGDSDRVESVSWQRQSVHE